MRFYALLVLLVGLFTLSACTDGMKNAEESAPKTAQRSEPETSSKQAGLVEEIADRSAPMAEKVSLNQADSANSASLAFDRKIIRNASLTLEVSGVSNSQQRLA